jgi:hypothetical protein
MRSESSEIHSATRKKSVLITLEKRTEKNKKKKELKANAFRII